MNPTHELIVSRFRAGETTAAISLSIGYSRQHVYRVLRKADGVTRRRSAPRVPRIRYLFQSRTDGEYCQCRHCEKLGYGIDSWHPVTLEFWKEKEGRLHLAQCLACISEVQQGRRGFVSAGERA